MAMASTPSISTGKLVAAWVVFVGMSLAAGFFGMLTSGDGVTAWYPHIAKPAWTPPNWIFAPVWTALYVMMGTAAWLIWQRLKEPNQCAAATVALVFFLLQLLLNGFWSFIFFGLREPGFAAGEIVVLLLAVLTTTVLFARLRPITLVLVLPYLAWVGFATALNVEIWRLNA